MKDQPSPRRRDCRSEVDSSSAGDRGTENGAAQPGPLPGIPCRSPCARRGARRRLGRRACAVPCSTTARWSRPRTGRRVRSPDETMSWLGKAADGCLERTASKGRAQERAHHGESKPRPLGACRIGGWLDHHASRGRGERTATIRFHRSRSVGEEHLLRIGGDHCETLICRPPGTVIGERNRSRSIQPSRGG